MNDQSTCQCGWSSCLVCLKRDFSTPTIVVISGDEKQLQDVNMTIPGSDPCFCGCGTPGCADCGN